MVAGDGALITVTRTSVFDDDFLDCNKNVRVCVHVWVDVIT